ncbi:hypothetical protein Ciccas_004350 [Cichlidogyrus casuarinus]|uniref:Dual specificity phosphatase catalytic domain-containing protein n=1 Tax=Cichlidogyrus casuarinus TaxID=1844966 RepID=A0ABD2QC77_9PLAT
MTLEIDFYDYMDCQELYNILNSFDKRPLICDRNYLTILENAVDAGYKVLIASPMGYSRNNAVAIAYLIKHESMTLRQAWSELCKVNCRTRLNWSFLDQLKRLEAKCLGTGQESIDEEEEMYYHS